MILKEIRLLAEGDNLSEEDKFKKIAKDEIKRFPKNGTGNFFVYDKNDRNTKEKYSKYSGKNRKLAMETIKNELGFENWARGTFKHPLAQRRMLYFIAETPGVYGDVITAKNESGLDKIIDEHGFDSDDYNLYLNTMFNQYVAIKKGSKPDKSGKYDRNPFKSL